MNRIVVPLNWRMELNKQIVDSIEDDFILLENTFIIPGFNHPFKIDMIIAIICLKGTLTGAVDLKEYEAKAPCLFTLLPNQILQYKSISDDFSGYFIIMSQKFADSMFANAQDRFPLFFSVKDNPSMPLNVGELDGLLIYYKMLRSAVRLKENPHRIEVVKHLTQAFFYGLSYQYHKLPNEGKKSKQEVVIQQFLSLAHENFKTQREVEFYADKLCLTPKYLSKLIKDLSGKSAPEWISDFVTLEAKTLLKSTNMTIQQISDELNFTSQSFFGKFFKRQVGQSPKHYREN